MDRRIRRFVDCLRSVYLGRVDQHPASGWHGVRHDRLLDEQCRKNPGRQPLRKLARHDAVRCAGGLMGRRAERRHDDALHHHIHCPFRLEIAG